MQRRKLGTQGLEVSALGLGTMGMTGVAGMPEMYGSTDDAEGIATIHRALELGIDFLDTAEVYGPRSNEELVRRALVGRSERVVLATKFGFKFTPDDKIAGVDGRPENVRRALDGCLQRLGVDCIDLWYQHRRDFDVPIEDTVGAMAEQVRGLTQHGIAVLLVDHDMSLVASVCDRVVVLDLGTVIATGAPVEVLANPAVVAAYLGSTAASEAGR